MMDLDPAVGALAGRAAQVLEWDRSHRHCGVCGTPTRCKPGERARVCPACGHVAYPRLSPR
jgi:NAD+ diphosphatase